MDVLAFFNHSPVKGHQECFQFDSFEKTLGGVKMAEE